MFCDFFFLLSSYLFPTSGLEFTCNSFLNSFLTNCTQSWQHKENHIYFALKIKFSEFIVKLLPIYLFYYRAHRGERNTFQTTVIHTHWFHYSDEKLQICCKLIIPSANFLSKQTEPSTSKALTTIYLKATFFPVLYSNYVGSWQKPSQMKIDPLYVH